MKYSIAVFCLLMVTFVNACEVCGAVNSSQGIGTTASGNRHSIGLTWQHRTYCSTHESVFSGQMESSRECFQRIDLSGSIRISPRFQVRLLLPYSVNEQEKSSRKVRKTGISDPAVTLHFFAVNQQDSAQNSIVRWSLGGGLKLPLASYTVPHDSVLLLFPGTGTWDGVIQSSAYLQRGKRGIIQETSMIIRGTNQYDYTPGSLINATIFGFQRFSSWSLFGGFQYSWNGIDYIDRTALSGSLARGQIVTATAGATIQWGNLILQGNYHLPVFQKLGNGSVKQTTSFTAGMYYLFN